jgi:hypothetical protein
MKHLRTLLLILPFAAITACEEEPLPVNFDKGQEVLKDTSYIRTPVSPPQDKMVLLEDFTGVHCAPCPNGHVAVKDILQAYPGRVAAVAIHPGAAEFPTAYPFPGEPDFNTSWGSRILSIIGKPAGIPYGAADRVKHSNLISSWSSYVADQLAAVSPVNLELSVLSYNDATRELTYEIKVEVTENLSDILYFSTMITEDGIVSKQKYDQGVYDPYTHNHILRNMPDFGVALNPSSQPELVPGRMFIKQYKTTLAQDWVAEECNIIAFVHKDVEVIQTAEKDIR